MKKKIEQVQTLLDALPYIKRYRNEIFVIKYGGSAQLNPELKEKFAHDIILMYLVGIKPVIVHGGGNAIGATLDKMKIESHFVDGLRVTVERAFAIIEQMQLYKRDFENLESYCQNKWEHMIELPRLSRIHYQKNLI